VTYFERLDERRFQPTAHVGGGWNPEEQHVAPPMGLLAHAVELDRDRRRDDGLALARLSYDILGVLTMTEVEVDVRVVRAGRTIELVEAVMTQHDRTAVVLRAWLMARGDTAALAGSDLPRLDPPSAVASWDPTTVWPGGFIASVDLRRSLAAPGRGSFWVRSDVPLLDEAVAPTAHVVRLFDITNGMTVRADPAAVRFPNLDLTAHLFRDPEPGWLGFDTTVSFGPAGHGLTSSVVHDESGPLGTVAQTLTVRPVAVR
jgi:hypothetical protein